MRVSLREATAGDLPEILEIERQSFPHPWSLASFKRELTLPFSRLVVAMADLGQEVPQLVGYLCRWLVADELHILNIAVHPDFRRRNIGAGLLSEAIHEAKLKKAARITLEVRRSNLGARALYRKFGFEERRLRRNYYGPSEDAVIMELPLD